MLPLLLLGFGLPAWSTLCPSWPTLRGEFRVQRVFIVLHINSFNDKDGDADEEADGDDDN